MIMISDCHELFCFIFYHKHFKVIVRANFMKICKYTSDKNIMMI